MQENLERLQAWLRERGGALVAFSGGVDSSLLLAAARDALGDRVLAVTISSPINPERELAEARSIATQLGARHLVIQSDELADAGFCSNPVNRCYLCKKARFIRLKEIARLEGLECFLEGSNCDDLSEYRPGIRAVEETGGLSPYLQLGFGKAHIREMARARGLPNWNKPAAACLASRIPYGEEISRKRLHRIELAEDLLLSLGFRQVRVRDHGTVARIEVEPDDIPRFLGAEFREQIHAGLRGAGFTFVTLDLKGYRGGAMDEDLNLPDTPH